MLTKILAATALTLALGTAGFAQTSATQGVNPIAEPDPAITTNSTSPGGWSNSMNSAFYTDDGVTLRPEAEIRANWSTLSEAERLQVKADCAAQVNAGSTENTGRSDSAGTEGARTEQTAISQICLWTENL